MRTSRRACLVLGAATGLASIGLAFAGATSAQADSVDRTPTTVQTFTSAGNEAAYWNTFYGVSNCYKVDSASAWSGSVYVLAAPAAHLIIKAATWNYIWVDASPGSFGTPLSGTGGHNPGYTISHLIICPAVASTTASPTDSTTTASPTDSTTTASPTDSTTTASPTDSTTTASPTDSTTTAAPTDSATSTDPVVLPSTGGSGTASDSALPIPNTGGGLPHTGGVALRLLLTMALALISIGAFAYGSSRKIARTH